MFTGKRSLILALVSLAVLSGCRTRQRTNLVKLEPAKSVNASQIVCKEEKKMVAVTRRIAAVKRLESKVKARGLDNPIFEESQLDMISSIGFEHTADSIRMTSTQGIELCTMDEFKTLSKIAGAVLPDIDTILSVSISEGVPVQTITEVLCMTTETGIPIEDTAIFLSMAHIAEVPMRRIIELLQLSKKHAVLAHMLPIMRMVHKKNIASVIEVFMIAEKEAIPMGKIIDAFILANASNVPIENVVDVLVVAKKHKIPLEDILPIFTLPQANNINLNIIIATARASMTHGIPLIHVSAIAEFSYKTKIPPSVLISICAEISEHEKLSPAVIISIFPLCESITIKTIDIHIGNIAKTEGISLAVLRLSAMKSILAIISHAKQDSALQLKDNFIKSRWEMVTPEEFTKLWEIKCKAEELEKQGLNTDNLWHQFWNIYMSEPETEDTTGTNL